MMINRRRYFIFFLMVIIIGLAAFGENWLFSSKANTMLSLKLEGKEIVKGDHARVILKNSDFNEETSHTDNKKPFSSTTKPKEGEKTSTQSKKKRSLVKLTVPEGLLFDEKATEEHNKTHQLNKSTYEFDKKTRNLVIEFDQTMKSDQTAVVFRAVKKGRYQLSASIGNEAKSDPLTFEVKEKSLDQTKGFSERKNVSSKEKEQNRQSAKKRPAAAKEVGVSVDVSTAEEFDAAMRNKNVTTIHVRSNINFSNYNTSSVIHTEIGPERYRDITIEGHYHTVDFKGRSYALALTTQTPLNFTIRNMEMYGRSYYGPIRVNNHPDTQMNFENIIFEGAQLTEAQRATVNFSGDLEMRSVNEYADPFAEATVPTEKDHSIVAANKIIFKKNSTYWGTTENAAIFRLVKNEKGTGLLKAEENAQVTLRPYGSSGEGGLKVLEINGDLEVGPNAEMNFRSPGRDSLRGGLVFGPAPSTLTIEENGKLNVEVRNGYTIDNTPIYLNSNSQILVANKGSLTVTASNQNDNMQPVVSARQNATFAIGEEATFRVASDGNGAKNLVKMGRNSRFSFANAKAVDLDLRRNMNHNARVLSMDAPSVFNSYMQQVEGWQLINMGNIPDYIWTPMNNIEIPYTGNTFDPADLKASSIVKEVEDDFKANYRMENFSRVLYSFIPNVAVTVDELTDNVAAENSHIIRGKATAGAWVNFSGDPAIPEGHIPSQDSDDTTLYHVKADAKGNYEYRLPPGRFLTSGNEVKVYAFLNSKTGSTSTIVKDKTPPETVTLDDIKDTDTALTGESEPGAKIEIYKENQTLFATGKVENNKKYAINLSESQKPLIPYERYYAVAIDSAGNRSEPSSQKAVKDTTPPTADAIVQWLTLGENFTTDAKSLVTNVADNADIADLTYAIAKEPDVSKVGYTEAQVLIKDKAGNEKIITIPVFVKDDSVAMNDKVMLTANDSKIFVYEYPDKVDELNRLLIKRAGVKAWEIPSGKEITDQVRVKDDGGILKEVGVYNVTFTIDGVDKTAAMTVSAGTLEIEKATLSLSFGTQKLSPIKQETASENDMNITVNDTRTDTANWKLSAKLKSPFMTQDGYLLPSDSLQVKTKRASEGVSYKAINHEGLTDIYASDRPKNGITEINLNNPEDSQLILTYGIANLRINKVYSTEIVWALSDAP